MIDLILAMMLLPLLVVTFVIIALPQWHYYGNIFFVQSRPGKDGRLFGLIKFQTMRSGNEPDDERTTPLGTVLRKTALDELPQIFNVLKGDMSFIGPRPLLVEYLPLYSPHHMKRHSVKPGITGLAQINAGRISTWKEKLDLDAAYAEKMSFTTDLYIAWQTIYLLIAGAGQEKEKLTGKFSGYE